MKRIIILGDGMADWPITSFNGKTPLQHANTPYMDKLARLGRNGLLATIPEGFDPGSEVANLSVLGYHLPTVFQGRGVLEAAAMGVELKPGQVAFRCNLITTVKDKIKNHSAGHISTPEAHELIAALQEVAARSNATLYPGVSYRHLLVCDFEGYKPLCIPPHDVLGEPWEKLLPPRRLDVVDFEVIDLYRIIYTSRRLFKKHPVNIRRIAEGKEPATMIWPWSPGTKPNMKPLSAMYPTIGKGAVISAVDLIRGIGHYAGLERIDVEGATGLYDTNYEGKAQAAIEALRTHDFVYLHIEASDEAGHEGDASLKARTIEDLDSRVVGPIYEAVKDWDEPVAIAVLPDHPTPCELRTHTDSPVPFLIWHPGIEPDAVQAYSEQDARQGSYGLLRRNEFMNAFTKQ